MSNESRVNWYISANVECPYCGHDNDFMKIDDWHESCEPGQNVDTFSQPVIMECKKCKKEIQVMGSDY